MALRGCKPSSIKKRLKALFYGIEGSGKTTAAIQFPSPYLIDTEKGAENDQYVKLLEKSGGAIYQTSDFSELLTEVKSLLSEKHNYKTLIIDPLTILYNDLLEKSAIKNGTDFGRHYVDADREMKKLLNLLMRIDMNVIITSHAKNQYGSGMVVLGQTFDCYKKLGYLFDLVFEVQIRAEKRVGLVKKTRVSSFSEGDIFPFSYQEISKRYGIDNIEKEMIREILASEEQVEELLHLINIFNVEESTYKKWLDKELASSFDEMKSDSIQKCIDHVKSKAHIFQKEIK